MFCKSSQKNVLLFSKVKSEVMEANNGDILLTLRVYDRTTIDREFLLTITLELVG